MRQNSALCGNWSFFFFNIAGVPIDGTVNDGRVGGGTATVIRGQRDRTMHVVTAKVCPASVTSGCRIVGVSASCGVDK